MDKKQQNLIYAIKNGVPTSVEDVESGLKCGCVCPACGRPLIARKGNKMIHHFAHHSEHNCEYGYESSLHLAAKEILSKAKRIMLPAVYISFPNSPKKDELYCEAKEVKIDRVELEKRFEDIVPDVVMYIGGKQLFLEIYVTHAIDELKLSKLKKNNISTIEIDLSKKRNTITYQELNDLLLGVSDEKKWKYNSVANKFLQRFYDVSDHRNIISRGYTYHIDNCPIKMRSWRGKPYANFIDDCHECEYCISYQFNGGMLCSGRNRIAQIKDFYISLDKRIKDSDKKVFELKNEAFEKGICPNCGGKIIERKSKYGTFFGCSNYPHCRFIATMNQETGKLNW